MKNTLITVFFTLTSCIFLIILLVYSKDCISLASNGLLIWFNTMIPSLFPFMVLSGFMVRSGLSLKIGQWLQPFLGIFFRLPSHMLYAIFMGFLCGFPMGAKIVADMLEKEQITVKEGEYLLAFCNNIGPLYMLGYVIPLFGYENTWQVLGFMYLVPLVYGLFLRYIGTYKYILSNTKKYKNTINKPLLSACTYKTVQTQDSNYLFCFQQSLSSAIEQITLLGGCMVFFNCLLIFPQILGAVLSKTTTTIYSPLLTAILSSLIEIGGGLQKLSENSSHISIILALLTIGGLSCITQTYFIIKNTGLKISTYIRHKIIQSCIYIILFNFFLMLPH